MGHATNLQELGQGENLYWQGHRNDLSSEEGAWDGTMQGWYGEEGDWNYDTSASDGGVTGHFTQVVWKATTQVGCAMNTNCDNMFASQGFRNLVVVCRYSSAGNYWGQYAANVKKLVTEGGGSKSATCP